jgi:nitrogen-specific signal transduction histidine kinase
MSNPISDSSSTAANRSGGNPLFFKTLLDAIPGFVILADRDGCIVYCNRALSLAAGWDHADDRTEHQLRDLVSPDIALRLLDPEGSKRVRANLRSVADTEEVHVEWSTRTWPSESGEQVLITGHDTSRERELEEYLASNQWYETMGALSGGLAHDFNNILAAILGLSEIIGLRLPKDDPLHPFADKIGESVERAKGLVARFSQFSRKPTMLCEPQPTGLILTELSTLIQGFLTGSISIETKIAEDTPWCEADRHVLEQILVNCANFFRTKLRDSGGQCMLSSRPSKNGNHVLIELRGAGEGILGIKVENLFDMVLDSSANAYHSGTGLYAARHLAAQTHSVLYARRADPRTITFVLEVPVGE